MRAIAIALVVVITSTPLLQAATVPDAPAPCPMAAGAAGEAPCLTAPCPCDHSAPGSVVPGALAPAVVGETAIVLRRNDAGRRLAGTGGAGACQGHPFPIDHPPSPRA